MISVSPFFFILLGSNKEPAPIRPCDDPWDRDVPGLDTVVPLESTTAYDILDVVQGNHDNYSCLKFSNLTPGPDNEVRYLFF